LLVAEQQLDLRQLLVQLERLVVQVHSLAQLVELQQVAMQLVQNS
jgi:hypothetical protein